ncbi:MAG: D-alanyl-D-alanine carboxypeptidase [Firmicutes bacterium]|nr:D-alanyl-D-alanine carboxypeptidase [Bacillota bacterium]
MKLQKAGKVQKNKAGKFSKWLALWVMIVVLLATSLVAWAAPSAPPVTSAAAVVVMEQSSGRVLHSSNMNAELYPASTTKIMTALLTLENMELDDKITLPDDFINVGETSLGLEPGARQTVEELLMAMMLRSANDAAQALAIGVAGSVEAFADMMNEKAAELGMKHSHFVNPHGLHNSGHYSSAYDLAIVARAALEHEEFRRIITTESFTVKKVNGEEDFRVGNRNGLLARYQYADGIKTGYTRQAGNCFVSSATRNGMQLIAVVLNSSDIYADAEALLEWGFANYSPTMLVDANTVQGEVTVLNGGRDSIDVLTEKPLYAIAEAGKAVNVQPVIDLPASVAAPVHRGEVIGSISYTDDNGYTYSTNLLAARDVGRYTLRLVVRQAFQSVWQVFVVPFTS